MRTYIKKTVVISLALVIMLTLFIGCKSKTKNSSMSDGTENLYNTTTSPSKGIVKEDNAGSVGQSTSVDTTSKNSSALAGRKIIRSADIYAQTLDYDKSLSALNKLISDFGGFIQDSKVQTGREYNAGTTYRTAEYTIRIPSSKLDDFLNASGKIGTIITKNSKGEDISDQYFDTQAHLDALKIQEQRLLELLKKATQLSDILQLEKELTSVRYEIEQLTGSLKKWDALIDLSTVTVKIDEVKTITEQKEGFWDSIKSTFVASINTLGETMKALVLFLTAVLPFAIVLGIIALVIVFIIKKTSRKKK